MIEYSDEEIIIALKKREDKTLQKVFYSFKEEFLSWVSQRYQVYDIDDIYQEMFAALIVNAENGNLDNLKASVKTYFFTIGKYKLFKSFNKVNQMNIEDYNGVLKEDETTVQLQADFFQLNDQQLKLKKIIDEELQPRCKELLKRVFYENESVDEIINGMGLKNSDVVKSMKYRCLKRLRELYAQQP